MKITIEDPIIAEEPLELDPTLVTVEGPAESFEEAVSLFRRAALGIGYQAPTVETFRTDAERDEQIRRLQVVNKGLQAELATTTQEYLFLKARVEDVKPSKK